MGRLLSGELSTDGRRRWDGYEWIDRRLFFEQRCAYYASSGWDLVDRDDRMARFVRGGTTTDKTMLYVVLTVVTAGLFLPVWFLLYLFSGPRVTIVEL
jgi:hypothetical protein